MAADFVVRWTDFSGGEYGLQDPAKADRNQWSGFNMVEYSSGLVGPRNGLKLLPTVGLPNHDVAPGPVGFDTYGDSLVYVVDGIAHLIDVDTGAITPLAPFTTPATTPVEFSQGNEFLYATVGGKLYKFVDNTTTQEIPLPAGVQVDYLTRWNYYLVARDATTKYRIWHSKVSEAGPEFDVWEDNAFLDVGANEPITALQPLYNTLYVAKRSGWWAVTGVLGQLSSVRHITLGNGPIAPQAAASTTDNRIIGWPKEPVPAWFNGERTYLDEQFKIDGFDTVFPTHAVCATPTSKRLLMLGEQPVDADERATGMLQWDGHWSAHQFVQPMGGIAPSDVRHGYQLPTDVVFLTRNPRTVGDSPELYSYSHDPDRPAHAADRWASPVDQGADDLVEGYIELPAWYDGQGRQVMVRSVIVQFRKWPSGIQNSVNKLYMQAVPLGRYDGGTIDVEDNIWTEDSERADADGTDDSIRWGTGWQGWGNGFQIKFPRVAGVAIREVIALCEVRTPRT